MVICFTGFPLSGKSTLAKKLATKLGIERVSTGDIARSLGMGNEESIKTHDLSFAHDAMITEQAIEAAKAGKILDGFPRSVAQIELLKEQSIKHGFEFKVIFVTENPLVVFDRINERARESGRPEDDPAIVSGRLKASLAFLRGASKSLGSENITIFASRLGYEELERALDIK